jgi:hypothetical protein
MDDADSRVSCQGHRSSSAVTRGSSWATMSCLLVAPQERRGVLVDVAFDDGALCTLTKEQGKLVGA